MPTKAGFIAQLNQEFPEHWEWVIEHNPKTRPPRFAFYPELLRITVGEDVSHEYGTEVLLTAWFKGPDGQEYELEGAYFKNHHDSGVIFTSTSAEWGTVEEMMLNHLFGNLFIGDTNGPEEWNALPD